MLKQEFEQLYGCEVTQSVYEALELIYMADESTKAEFVARVRRQRLVESISQALLTEAEARISKVRIFAQWQKSTGDADYDRATSLSMDGLANKEMTITNQMLWTHNVSIMGLEKSANMQRVLETLEA